MNTADDGKRRDNSFPKAQKLCGDRAVGHLFDAGSSFAKYPFRIVYLTRETKGAGESPVRMLVSVGKKRFKRAVKRNRVKRLTREAWRHSKGAVEDALASQAAYGSLHVAFVFCGDRLPSAEEVGKAVGKAAERLASMISGTYEPQNRRVD